jgi:hypothetical protein
LQLGLSVAKVRKDRDEILAKLYAARPEAKEKIQKTAGYGMVVEKSGKETFMAMGSLGGGLGIGGKDHSSNIRTSVGSSDLMPAARRLQLVFLRCLCWLLFKNQRARARDDKAWATGANGENRGRASIPIQIAA